MNFLFSVIMFYVAVGVVIAVGIFIHAYATGPFTTTTGLRYVPCLQQYSTIKKESGFANINHHTVQTRFRWWTLIICRAVLPDGGVRYTIHRPGRCPHCHYTTDSIMYGTGGS